MSAKHSPGPWHIGKGLAAKIVYGTDGYAVANATVYHGKTTRDQAEANAILIAAAPELLDACEAALLQEDIASSELGYQLRAAIAKAKGVDQ